MKSFQKILLIVSFLGLCQYVHAQKVKAATSSPDGNIVFQLSVKDKQLFYSIEYHKKQVIEQSVLNLSVDDKWLNNVSSISEVSRLMINETYAIRGLHNMAVNHCNDVVYNIADGTATVFSLEVKVFNDGVAFRYKVNHAGNTQVTGEGTVFTLPAASTVWSQPDIGNYEGKFTRQKIEDVPAGQLAGPPLTVQLANGAGFAAITEGGVSNFAGMSLKANGQSAFKANLTGVSKLSGNIETPWRIVEIGKDLNTLVNADIIANVSPAPDKALFPEGINTAWVKPGKCVWSWLAGNGDVTFENMKRYSKWAGELGIAYNLVDEGWSRWNDGGKDKWTLMKELVDYSAQQHVKIWVWKAYPDRNGVAGLKDPAARKAFFAKCKEIGVVGLKIDFFDNESQEVMDFYEQAARDAAELHLLLDFHGANKPTGQSRTWPNELSREGIRGLENGTDWPAHNATLPFTRFLAGHGDYTPLSFRQDLIKGTTLAHQVATLATYTSSFMCLAVDPEKLLSSPVKDLVIEMPINWDETIVLPQSVIGEVSLFAKRKGTDWYLAIINGEAAQNLSIDLSFLQKGNYKASILEDDAADPAKAMRSTKSVMQTANISLQLQAGGGYLAKFEKQ